MAVRSSRWPARSARWVARSTRTSAWASTVPPALAWRRARARDAGEQLLIVEGLAQVVVGPVVQPAHLVGNGVPGGEEEHGRLVTRLAKPPQERQAVRARQPPVEHHQVPRSVLQGMPAVVAVGGPLDGEALLAQASNQEVRDLLVVLDDQHPDTHQAPSSTHGPWPTP